MPRYKGWEWNTMLWVLGVFWGWLVEGYCEIRARDEMLPYSWQEVDLQIGSISRWV